MYPSTLTITSDLAKDQTLRAYGRERAIQRAREKAASKQRRAWRARARRV